MEKNFPAVEAGDKSSVSWQTNCTGKLGHHKGKWKCLGPGGGTSSHIKWTVEKVSTNKNCKTGAK